MIAFIENDDVVRRNPRILIVETGTTVPTHVIATALKDANYYLVDSPSSEQDSSNTVSKHDRQREWWNTPKAERKRKRK